MPTIRIDPEVFGELQRLGKPFVDTPNSVLRRVLSLDRQNAPHNEDTQVDTMPSSIDGLVRASGVPFEAVTLIRPNLYRLTCRSGKVTANIGRQVRKLRAAIQAPKKLVLAQGLSGWDYYSPRGWYGAEAVEWHVADGDSTALDRAAAALGRLYQL